MFACHGDYDSDDAYLDFSDSDNDGDDDLDVLEKEETALREHRRSKHMIHHHTRNTHEESDFEQEMEDELSASMLANVAQSTTSTASSHTKHSKHSVGKGKRRRTMSSGAGTSDDGASAGEYYDNVYFDSSSEEELHSRGGGASAVCTPEKCAPKMKKHRVMTNDELFYDPDIDDENEVWVADQLRLHRGISSSKHPRGAPRSSPQATVAEDVSDPREGSNRGQHPVPQAAPRSDAVLACPACMTTLCLDCQRHEVYKTQFRAMFVMNCAVIRDEVLRHKVRLPRAAQRKRRRNKAHSSEESAMTTVVAAGEGQVAGNDQEMAEECYHPVHCAACNTDVAVFDQDEVYHFFNVLASHA